MKKSDYLLRYAKLAPLQIALIRAEEVFVMAKTSIRRPILDIGTSDGIFGEILFKDKKNSVDVGVDIDKDALSFCEKRKVYSKVLFADARKLPFPSDFFNTVMSNQSLEHIPNVGQVFKEVARVLKKGGKFLFLVPTIYLDDYWLTSAVFKKVGLKSVANLTHSFRNKIFKHYNLWTIKKWKKLLEENGFQLKKYRYVGSKKVYFTSELLWPFRIPFFILSRLFKKEILPPRGLSLYLAKIMIILLKYNEDKIPKQGPTMLVIAQKN